MAAAQKERAPGGLLVAARGAHHCGEFGLPNGCRGAGSRPQAHSARPGPRGRLGGNRGRRLQGARLGSKAKQGAERHRRRPQCRHAGQCAGSSPRLPWPLAHPRARPRPGCPAATSSTILWRTGLLDRLARQLLHFVLPEQGARAGGPGKAPTRIESGRSVTTQHKLRSCLGRPWLLDLAGRPATGRCIRPAAGSLHGPHCMHRLCAQPEPSSNTGVAHGRPIHDGQCVQLGSSRQAGPLVDRRSLNRPHCPPSRPQCPARTTQPLRRPGEGEGGACRAPQRPSNQPYASRQNQMTKISPRRRLGRRACSQGPPARLQLALPAIQNSIVGPFGAEL